MLDHGHPDAGLYAIARVRDEAAIIKRRRNSEMVTMGLLFQGAAHSNQEAGAELFSQLTSKLLEE